MPFRYVPLLRSKAGEVTALQHLAPAAQNRILPVFHLVTKVPVTFASELKSAWGSRTAALDGLFSFATTGKTTTFSTTFNELKRNGIDVIPSVEHDADPVYVAAVKKLTYPSGPRLLVKSTLPQLSKLSAWVAGQGWTPGDVDLLVSLGPLGEVYSDLFKDYVATVLSTQLPHPAKWKSVTLASSAAPKDLGQLASGRNDVPRNDWHLWAHVQPRVGYPLDYGDYGIAHPDLTEPPGVAMARATVSVRYTVDDKWIVLKGSSTSGRSGQPMPIQYRKHAQTLHADPEFDRLATTCWADQRITTIATTLAKSGSRVKWVEIGVNRHLSLVAERLP